MYSIDPVPLPHDGPPDIALWRIDIDFTASLDAPAFASLSDDERTRARHFRRHEDALRFASVRAALREELARRLDIAAHAVRFSLDANHRPHIADSDRFDFNVSHAGAHGLIAMSAVRRVGVDIEQCSDKFDWRSIAALTLDKEETAWIGRLDAGQRSAAFYDAWVAKEALVKTTGVGITRGLQHLTVLPRESTRVTLRKQIPADMRDVAAHWLAAPDAYAACVAWSETTFR
ncbi:4'-phosphopantetheinyl transferase family protein [Paraburkholderia phytofirmans]|jgi:4'-phosphopantetheinyl transferase|uniref:4'-phosphopantetheinyl transferase family protein n=1 Tax=Paraburkholderia phytofirmans TaxID=261302 RepID=UPI0038BB35B9